jgi:hypothetical protein
VRLDAHPCDGWCSLIRATLDAGHVPAVTRKTICGQLVVAGSEFLAHIAPRPRGLPATRARRGWETKRVVAWGDEQDGLAAVLAGGPSPPRSENFRPRWASFCPSGARCGNG